MDSIRLESRACVRQHGGLKIVTKIRKYEEAIMSIRRAQGAETLKGEVERQGYSSSRKRQFSVRDTRTRCSV